MRSRDRDHPGQHGDTPSLLKTQKISWAQWHVPVIPATQEAEAEELPEPRRRRLRWAEITPLHSSLAPGDRVRLCLKKKKIHSFCLSVKYFTAPWFLKGSFAGNDILGWQVSFFFFSTLNVSSYYLLACKISTEKFIVSLMWISLYVTWHFSPAVFRMLCLWFLTI